MGCSARRPVRFPHKQPVKPTDACLPACPRPRAPDEGRLQKIQGIFEAKFLLCQEAQTALIRGSAELASLKDTVAQLTSTNSDLVGGC